MCQLTPSIDLGADCASVSLSVRYTHFKTIICFSYDDFCIDFNDQHKFKHKDEKVYKIKLKGLNFFLILRPQKLNQNI